jgi:hypothetical protein
MTKNVQIIPKREVQVKEIVTCGKNPDYFMKKYCKIQHAQKGLIPFKTYPFQDDCVRDFNEHRFNIVLKSRQLGLSTVTAMYAIWLAIFHRDKNILIIATKQAVAVNLVKKVKTALKSLPSWLMIPEIKSTTKQHVEFSNGSSIKAIPTSDDAGRSEALSLLIIDEAAFIRNFDELWTGLYSTLSTGGRAIILSTPNGMGGKYYELYTKAETGENQFHPIKLLWDVHPDRDQAWFDSETKNMSLQQAAQELMCDFVSSGETYIGAELLNKIRASVEPPIAMWGPNNDFWVWKYATAGHEYILSADVSRGDGSDFSAIQVLDKTTSEQVAEFRGKIFPDQLGNLLCEAGKMYNNGLVCPEKNTYGWTVNKTLLDLEYKNLHFKSSSDKFNASYGSESSSALASKVGFDTQGGSKDKALTKMQEWLRNDYIKIRSSRTFDELKTFVSINDKLRAMKGKNDDLVMSLAIGCWLYDGKKQDFVEKIDLDKAILSAFSVNTRGRGVLEKYVDPRINYRPFSPLPDHVIAQQRNPGPLEEFDWVSR